VAVYNFGSRTTPLSADDQVSFANHAAALARQVPDLQNFIIGNEPNLNRFWLPQFNADGSDAAAPPTSRCSPGPTRRSRPRTRR
jgi:hypothetical protein